MKYEVQYISMMSGRTFVTVVTVQQIV